MMTWVKARLLLLAIAIVWLSLILFTWRGWYQVAITIAGLFIESAKRYAYNLWMAQDQDVNVIFGGNPDITVSSKVGYMKLQGSKTATAMAVVIDWLFWVVKRQKNHCVVSIEHDEEHY